MTLANKVALVTGGSQGIGAAIAARFAREGAHVAVVASSQRGKADSMAATIGNGARAYACDVRSAAATKELVASVQADFGGLDIVVNGAGVFFPTPAGDTAEGDLNRMVDINFKGTWNIVNAAAPALKARGGGKLINIASVAGVMGLGSYAVYTATKAAIIMMTRSLAVELAPSGINVNCIAPGNTATPMNEDIRTKPELKHFLDAMAARTPSGRTYSSPDDMAAIALFLASDASRAMHGACLLADEGFSAGL